MIRLFPPLTVLLFLGPVVAGLFGTLLPAFGYLPALGGEEFTLEPWRQLFAAPGLGSAVRLSLVTGFAATTLSLVLTVLVFAAGHGTPLFRRAKQAMVPLLAVPHLAIAVGLAFLIAPSGWLARLISPWLSGWQVPPDLALVQDPYGAALVLGLVVKETPFLILVTFAALDQVRAEPLLRAARTLGYGPFQAWIKVVLPLAYPQIRLPLYAVLAYSLSVVDMAIVLGPSTPPPLAPLLLRWFNDPDLAMRFQAAAGASLQFGIVLLVIMLWRGLEMLVSRLARPWLTSGRRGGGGHAPRGAAAGSLGMLLALALGSLLSLAIWAVAGRWRFPQAWPEEISVRLLARHLHSMAWPAWTTLTIAGMAATLALILVTGCLENESRSRRRAGQGALTLIYLPLLIPQIAFLFGVQLLFVLTGLDGSWLAVIWAHLLFVLPYVFLALADPYRHLDPRYARTALSLGRTPWQVLIRVKLPMLLRPILVAAAIGFAVSVAQYLPTLFAGAGRVPTLTTETLGLATAGNRRQVGAFGLALAVLPLGAFALALGVPAWRFRHRRAMRGEP